MFVLREYQQDCVNEINERFKSLNSQIVQLPTGSGKTVILWHVLKGLKKKSLIVAPTRELTEQIEETGKQIINKKDVYLKQKSYWPKDRNHLVMTGQAATFALNGNRFDNFCPGILVVDEAHRSRSKSLEKLINHFLEKGSMVLGLTATPERLDGRSLLEIYEELTYKISLIELIEKGYLVDLECYKIITKHKISEVKYQGSDLAPSSLKQLDVDARNEIILDVYKNRCADKKTIIFCLNVSHAEKIASCFVENNIRAMAIHGGLGKTKRRTIIKLFKEGKINVLCNCQLLTEGFDEPSIEAVILGRPTKSKALYCQMIGRGVRPFKGKESCLIYDLTDEIHNICNFNVLGGIGRESQFEWLDGERLTKAVNRHKLFTEEVEYDCEKFHLYEKRGIDKIKAASFQIDMMNLYNIPYLSDIDMNQAAYLIFKTILMRQHGIDSESYWKEWRKVLPGPGTREGKAILK